MTEPDKALLWAREDYAKAFELYKGHLSELIRNGDWDDDPGVKHPANGYRAGAAASAERIKELEARMAELERMTSVDGLKCYVREDGYNIKITIPGRTIYDSSPPLANEGPWAQGGPTMTEPHPVKNGLTMFASIVSLILAWVLLAIVLLTSR